MFSNLHHYYNYTNRKYIGSFCSSSPAAVTDINLRARMTRNTNANINIV